MREHLAEQPRALLARRVDQLFFGATSESVLNGLITFVSIVVIALLRQSHMLVEELYSLGEESEGAVGVESLDEL